MYCNANEEIYNSINSLCLLTQHKYFSFVKYHQMHAHDPGARGVRVILILDSSLAILTVQCMEKN